MTTDATATLRNIIAASPEMARAIVACLTRKEAIDVANVAAFAGEIPGDVLVGSRDPAWLARDALNAMIDIYEDLAWTPDIPSSDMRSAAEWADATRGGTCCEHCGGYGTIPGDQPTTDIECPACAGTGEP